MDARVDGSDASNQGLVAAVALDEFGSRRNVVAPSVAEVVKSDHFVALVQQELRRRRADEARSPGDQDSHRTSVPGPGEALIEGTVTLAREHPRGRGGSAVGVRWGVTDSVTSVSGVRRGEECAVPPDSVDRRFPVEALREAFAAGQFLLVYQPIFDLQTSAFVGVEALMRWRHPRLGLLGPDAFIDTLEASDLVAPVGRWTLETACSHGAAWHDSGYRFSVSVNVSARQWAVEDLPGDVRDALATSHFDPALLVLEVSRATIHGDEQAGQRLAALADLGVHRAVDDFVPDEGDLAALARLGVDVVKIDRSWVSAQLSSDPSAITAMAERAEVLGIRVIAAGIEDATQRDVLARERIGSGQGFWLSQPHEAGDIDRFLEDFSIFSGKPL